MHVDYKIFKSQDYNLVNLDGLEFKELKGLFPRMRRLGSEERKLDAYCPQMYFWSTEEAILEDS